MGFLHLGWDTATSEDLEREPLEKLSPAWEETGRWLDLRRPGLAAVRKIMGWSPLHLAAMEGKVQLIERLVQDFGCSITARSANSWTPLHYAAAHNQVHHMLASKLSYAGARVICVRSPFSLRMTEATCFVQMQVEAIQLLVKLGCEATVQDNVASTPLHVAAGEGHLDAIMALVNLVRTPARKGDISHQSVEALS